MIFTPIPSSWMIEETGVPEKTTHFWQANLQPFWHWDLYWVELGHLAYCRISATQILKNKFYLSKLWIYEKCVFCCVVCALLEEITDKITAFKSTISLIYNIRSNRHYEHVDQYSRVTMVFMLSIAIDIKHISSFIWY